MHTFAYEARNKNGALVKGDMQAMDANHVADQLMQDNLIPLKINKKSAAFSWRMPVIPFFGARVTSEALSVFCRQMFSLTKAGVPIVSAIQRLSEITNNKMLADSLRKVEQELVLGTSLSKALQHYPKVFSALIVALVTSAEANGRLDEAFLQASRHYELANITKKRIKTALRYPIMVVILAFSAIMLINVFVIPKFASLYLSFQTQLPLPTRMLIHFSSFVHDYWLMIIIGILILILVGFYFLRNPRFRVFIDYTQLKLPIFGNIIERIVMANFSRNLAMLLQTGVPLIESLSLVAGVVDNAYAKNKVLGMIESIEHGKNLSQAASNVAFFSPLILQMFSVGEETGNMDKMLLEASQFYEQEVDYDIKQLTDKIEPILIIFVGAIVLLLALGIFLPMWDLVYVVH